MEKLIPEFDEEQHQAALQIQKGFKNRGDRKAQKQKGTRLRQKWKSYVKKDARKRPRKRLNNSYNRIWKNSTS